MWHSVFSKEILQFTASCNSEVLSLTKNCINILLSYDAGKSGRLMKVTCFGLFKLEPGTDLLQTALGLDAEGTGFHSEVCPLFFFFVLPLHGKRRVVPKKGKSKWRRRKKETFSQSDHVDCV